MSTVQIPAVVSSAFQFFDFVSQITESSIPTATDDVPEAVGILNTAPSRFIIPKTHDEWMDAYLAAPIGSPKWELLNLTRLAAECLDEGDDVTALDFIMRALALAMHEFGDDAKRRAGEIMDKIHHDIVRVCCLGQQNDAVTEAAEILSAIEYAQTEEERVAVRRYARAMAWPDECVIAMNVIKRKEAANA